MTAPLVSAEGRNDSRDSRFDEQCVAEVKAPVQWPPPLPNTVGEAPWSLPPAHRDLQNIRAQSG